jgi:lipopolysaccharide export system permease protein
MKLIDKYIVKKFLSTFVLSIVLLLLIIIAFDVSEKIDEFIDRKAPLHAIVFHYYLNFIPYFINLFSPLFVFIAVVFVTSKMAGNTEIIAILSTGVSFRRLLKPFVFTGIFLALFSFFLQNFMIPPANAVRLEFEYDYIRKNKPIGVRDIHMQLSPGEYVYLQSFTFQSHTAQQFTLETIDFATGMSKKLSADIAKYDTTNGHWLLTRVYIRTMRDSVETLHFRQTVDTTLALTPKDLNKDLENVDVLDFFELNRHIKQQKMRGADNISQLEVERHRRIAFPFATVILTIIGVAVSSRKTRGGTGLHIGIGLSLSFGFILFMQVSSTFATNGNLPPMLAVWIPNIVFAGIAWMLVKWAPK